MVIFHVKVGEVSSTKLTSGRHQKVVKGITEILAQPISTKLKVGVTRKGVGPPPTQPEVHALLLGIAPFDSIFFKRFSLGSETTSKY